MLNKIHPLLKRLGRLNIPSYLGPYILEEIDLALYPEKLTVMKAYYRLSGEKWDRGATVEQRKVTAEVGAWLGSNITGSRLEEFKAFWEHGGRGLVKIEMKILGLLR